MRICMQKTMTVSHPAGATVHRRGRYGPCVLFGFTGACADLFVFEDEFKPCVGESWSKEHACAFPFALRVVG